MAALISISCVSSHLKTLSLSSSNSPHFPKFHLKPFSSSASISQSLFSQGSLSLGTSQRSRRNTIVCGAATARPADSAEKRHRQSETRRLRNKARKSEIRTRMRKVFDALKKLRKKTDAVPEEIIPIENLIAEAYSAIDKAVVKGVIHRNTAAHRKSRLARNKRAIEIKQGWYTPAAPATTTV